MKNLTIVCKDFEVTQAIKSYVADKMSSLNKYLNQDEDNITFNTRLGKVSNKQNHGKIFYAEVSIHTPEKNFGARMEAEEIYVAIDLLKDELADNIIHYKERVRDLERQNAIKFKEQIRKIDD